MKFKKAYKEMNDEIHASRALLHSILNDSQENKPSFFESFFRSRALVSALACVILITTVVISYSRFNHSASTEQTPSEANVIQTPVTPKMTKNVEPPVSDAIITNAEYYGEVLNRILDLATDTAYADVANESRIDPLDIFIDYPSEDNPSVVTISREVVLSQLIPDAACVESDGIQIAISASDEETEKAISDKILK